jgi:acetyl esterase
MRNIILLILLNLTLFSLVTAQESSLPSYPPEIPATRIETYKIVDEIQLYLWIFTPKDHQQDDSRPAIVFFFGGGWRSGTPTQFVKHCEYLADRGMVAMVADYRVNSRHGIKANVCVSDAKSAIRWIRQNAKRLGVDPNRIAAGGGSAGGHLAVATATLPLHDDPADNLSINCQPNALVLYNPVVILSPVPGKWESISKNQADFTARLGAEPKTLSPFHHIHSGISPTIIFHGTADTTVPFETLELFCQKMREMGNHCDLIGYMGAKHGFFNHGRNGNGAFIDTVNKMDVFLVSIGYLSPPPEIIKK